MAELLCSARDCAREAAYAVLWNNPKIHAPERRKVWLACEEHRAYLGQYLQVRGMLSAIVDVEEIPEGAG
ncbi:hypothetical protein GSY69_03020 [Brevibacterium sp. 5221]|uniref:Acetone carboxylase n=1 Tax=Brevibacterium rongguiense TaxID=2695267 RepID=A0A6N9H5A7_9MICO|nr:MULTISPECIES: hypothetical protein [Brevibacterium]MYM18976.1 hypothetical protein [Brevibacterium rongguiense]WAL40824.1 hypothetical protein BRM1_02840 [Brevibacterium sp. BRM-1]